MGPGQMRRPGKKMSSPERWEVTQLIKSGVLDVTEYPTFDEEGGTVRARSLCHLSWSSVLLRSLWWTAGEEGKALELGMRSQSYLRAGCIILSEGCFPGA